jgi:hypothetical protein
MPTTARKKPPTTTSNKINNPSYRLALTIAAIAATATVTMLLMPTSAQAAYADGPTSQLTVVSRLENGSDITGYYTALGQIDETTGEFVVQNQDFTPAHFTVNSGQSYTLSAGSYGDINFDHWLDTGSTEPQRTVNISSDVELVAIYKDKNAPPAPDPDGGDPPASSGGTTNTNGAYFAALVDKASVFARDPESITAQGAGVPDLNLSGYTLPGGSKVMEYHSMYDLLVSGMDISYATRAAEFVGINWASLSEAQQCYLVIVLNMDIPLDENGLPVQNPA